MSLDYDNLLKRAYTRLPEKATTTARFEMPVVDSFNQGNKTIIKNFDTIVQKLRREPELLAKYFSKELAVPSSIDGGRLILQGKFYQENLNSRLSDFANKYVLCKECKKPDTNLKDVPPGITMVVCEACGARSPVK